MSVPDFLSEHATTILTLIGTLSGVLIAQLGSFFLPKRQLSLRLWEKLIDKRIIAHEKAITLSIKMRIMMPIGGIDGSEIRRSPQVMQSKEYFQDWLSSHLNLVGEGSTWLSTEAMREFNFVQDYFVTVYQNLSTVPTEKFPLIGDIIRQDFVDLSSSLEKAAYNFFKTDIHRLDLRDLKDRHKYETSETQSRLAETAFMKRIEEINATIQD